MSRNSLLRSLNRLGPLPGHGEQEREVVQRTGVCRYFGNHLLVFGFGFREPPLLLAQCTEQEPQVVRVGLLRHRLVQPPLDLGEVGVSADLPDVAARPARITCSSGHVSRASSQSASALSGWSVRP